MQDTVQQGMQALASQNVVARDAIIVCTAAVVYVMAAAWLVVVARRRFRCRRRGTGRCSLRGGARL